MTLTSTAHARPPRRRRLPSVLATAVALVVSVLVLAVPTGAVAATEPDATTEAQPVVFTMAPQNNGLITPDQPLTVTVAVQNPSESTISSRSVRLMTSTTPLQTRAELDAWVDTPPADDARTERTLSDTVVPSVAGHGVGVIDLSIGAESLADLGPGVYPLRADYAGPEGNVSAASVLVVPGEAGSGALAVVVPIIAPAIETGLLNATQLATLTASRGALRTRLDAVAGTSAILAVDPAIVAAIRVLGTSAPDSAVRWLDDLMSLPNSRFALQFGDADIATQLSAGTGDLLSVRSLSSYLTASALAGAATATPTDSPAATPTSDATATPEPTSTPAPGSGAPTLDELTDIGLAREAVFWPATGTAGSEVVARLGAITVDDTPSITLIDSGAMTADASASPTAATTPWATAGDAHVLAYDAETSAALAVAAATDDALTRAGALAEASAYAALAAATQPDATLLVAVDRSAVGSTTSFGAAVSAAVGLAGRSAVDLTTLTAGGAVSVPLNSVPSNLERADALNALLADEATLSSFATILTEPTVLTGPERASILQLIGNGWIGDDDASREAFTTHRERTQTTLTSVSIVQPSDITFAATSAPLPFSIRNDLPWAVSLVLITTQNDPRLIVQNTTPVEAGPSQNTRVQVPVEARVGSGESSLTLQLRSPSMVAIGDPVPVHVAVRAEWESVGLVIMIVLVAGLIVVGIIRTVLRRRRSHAVAVDESADLPAEENTDG